MALRVLLVSIFLISSHIHSASAAETEKEPMTPVPAIFLKLTDGANKMLVPDQKRQINLKVVSMFSTLKVKDGALFPYVKILVKNISGNDLSGKRLHFFSKFHNLLDGKQIVFEFNTKTNFPKGVAKVFKFFPKEGFPKDTVSNLDKGVMRMLIGSKLGDGEENKSVNFNQVLLHGSIRTIEK